MSSGRTRIPWRSQPAKTQPAGTKDEKAAIDEYEIRREEERTNTDRAGHSRERCRPEMADPIPEQSSDRLRRRTDEKDTREGETRRRRSELLADLEIRREEGCRPVPGEAVDREGDDEPPDLLDSD